MKVILKSDIAKLGLKSEVKDVPTGHAINFLIPKGLVVPATSENLRKHNVDVQRRSEQKEEQLTKFRDIMSSLADETISVRVEANEKGHLYKGFGAEDIARVFAEKGMMIEKENVVLDKPIKEIGVHEISLCKDDITGICRLEVVKK